MDRAYKFSPYISEMHFIMLEYAYSLMGIIQLMDIINKLFIKALHAYSEREEQILLP